MDFKTWNQQENIYNFNGHRIAYHHEGNGPPLLMVHGFPTSSWDWHEIWHDLTQAYTVIAPDLLGFGHSDKPQGYNYSLFEQADLVTALVQSKGYKSIHIMAHDYGDTVVQELLARQNEGKLPITIESVALLNGGIIPGMHRPRLMQTLLISPIGGFIARLINFRSFSNSFAPIFGQFTRPTQQELEEFWAHIRHNQGQLVTHKLIYYMQERKENYDRWVNTLKHPGIHLCLIFGDVDPVSGKHMSDAFRALNANAPVHELKSIGHYPQTEAPELVLEHYDTFRKSLTPPVAAP